MRSGCSWALSAAEHPPAIDPLVTQCRLLGQLPGGLLSQKRHRLWRPANQLAVGAWSWARSPVACRRSTTGPVTATVLRHNQVAPGQTQSLAGSRSSPGNATGEADRRHCPEGVELLLRRDGELPRRAEPRAGRTGGGVGLQVAPLHGITQGPMQHGAQAVTVLERGRRSCTLPSKTNRNEATQTLIAEWTDADVEAREELVQLTDPSGPMFNSVPAAAPGLRGLQGGHLRPLGEHQHAERVDAHKKKKKKAENGW